MGGRVVLQLQGINKSKKQYYKTMPPKQLPHTAIPSWSGFIYQGRIALYHALKILLEKSAEELNGLFVQIDSIEDFAIIKYGENDEIIPITIHQIKAVKSNLYSIYKSDFEQLEQKRRLIANPNVDAYFHLANKNEKTKQEIEALHNSLKIYCYEDEAEFCPLDSINTKIKTKIKLVLQKYNIDGHDNNGKIELLYNDLEKIISDKLIYIHSLNHSGTAIRNAAYDNPIPLILFLNSTCQDIAQIVQDEKYFEALVRNNLNEYYQEYCVENDEARLTDGIKSKLDTYLLIFNSLNSQEFKSFIQQIRPHKKISYGTLKEYKDNTLDKDEMKDVFFKILDNLKQSNTAQRIGWTCKEYKNYFPTTLNYSNTEDGKTKASIRILDTVLSVKVDVPFNSDYLITSECNVDNMEAQANKITTVSEREASVITNWKRIHLIDIETAKNKLND